MDKVTGVIESRELKDIEGRGKYAGQISQRITLTVNGETYSTFSNSIPADVAERLGALKTGDEVELTYKENPGKGRDGSPVTYLNIVDAVRVDRVGGSPTAPPAVQSTGQAVHKTRATTGEAPDARVRSMALAYAKDVWVSRGGAESPVEVYLSLAKRFEKYIQTGE